MGEYKYAAAHMVHSYNTGSYNAVKLNYAKCLLLSRLVCLART